MKHLKAYANHASLNAGSTLFYIWKAIEAVVHTIIPPQVDHSAETVDSLSKSNLVHEFLYGLRVRN